MGSQTDGNVRAPWRCYDRHSRLRAQGFVPAKDSIPRTLTPLTMSRDSCRYMRNDSTAHAGTITDREGQPGKYGEDSKLIVGDPKPPSRHPSYYKTKQN